MRGKILSETKAKLNKYYLDSAPKRLKMQKSAEKVMASVFWDAHGVTFIDYLEKGRTTTGAYYAALLDRLVDEIRNKRPHLKKKKIIFHDDNASSHTLNIAQAKKHELGFKSLPHPLYSTDKSPLWNGFILVFPLKWRILVPKFQLWTLSVSVVTT